MNAAELDRIAMALKAAIAEARLRLAAADMAVVPGVRDIIVNARETHDLLLEALLASAPLATAQYRWLADSTGNAIDALEALVAPKR